MRASSIQRLQELITKGRVVAQKLMFVDDDRSLLRTLERNLSFDYELDIAESGASAIELLESAEEPYSVFVVDLKMPKMDGISTIVEARKRSPDSVFLMLSGNQDRESSRRAINEARVFRFLNKPCEMVELRSFIDIAQVHYRQSLEDKKILSESFVDAIGFDPQLFDMPVTGGLDTTLIVDTLNELETSLEFDCSWVERVGARISLVGLALLTAEEQYCIHALPITDRKHQDAIRRLCQSSAELVESIPRLGNVAEVLTQIPHVHGTTQAMSKLERSAMLIKATMYWNLLTMKGITRAAAVAELSQLMPDCCGDLLRAFRYVSDHREHLTPWEVPSFELQPGMVAYADIAAPDNRVLVARGERLTQRSVDHIRELDRNGFLPPIYIVESSCFARSFQEM